MIIEGYKDLGILHKSLNYMVSLYKCTSSFPILEASELVTDIRTAAMELCNNIVTGYAGYQKSFSHSLDNAENNLSLIVSNVDLSFQNGYIKQTEQELLVSEANQIMEMIATLKNKTPKLMHDTKITLEAA
ncbi:MAG: four helix bundle protein [Rickettsiales bacterium]|nr:four helix bundle protein [Rickettsiales bacterium]